MIRIFWNNHKHKPLKPGIITYERGSFCFMHLHDQRPQYNILNCMYLHDTFLYSRCGDEQPNSHKQKWLALHSLDCSYVRDVNEQLANVSDH